MSVDSPERNEALRQRWGLPFAVLSDPGGEDFFQPLGLWNPEERNGLAIPALMLLSSDGEELFRTTSRDFADRIHDEDALSALEARGLPSVTPEPIPVPTTADLDLPGAFKRRMFSAYFRGNMYGAIAIQRRIVDEAARQEARAHRKMAKSFLEVWEEWKPRLDR